MYLKITADFISDVLLSAGASAKLQFRISTDGTTFTDWKDFVPVAQTFRYIDFQILLSTNDTTKSPEVNTISEYVDVPDVDKYGSATIAIGGSAISYGHTYYNNPTVLPTAIGSGLSAQLQSVSLNNFVVKVVNTSGVDVGGSINWYAKGF